MNLSGASRPRLRDILWWRMSRVARPEAYSPPVISPDFEAIHSPDRARITATWIGHASFLLQLGGRNFLLDPHFGNYCSPVRWRAFERRGPPGLSVEQLPHIDAVLISHSHYDHLDRNSLRSIKRRQRGSREPGIVCPSGLGPLLRRWGMRDVTEMEWGEAGNYEKVDGAAAPGADPVRITCIPTQHGAARTPFDRDGTLWCGWLLEYRDLKVGFLGDSGYAPFFAGLGERYGPLDLAMIPIGAYEPRWLMEPLHMSPEEAVRVHRDLRSMRSIAMHWGTFALADDPLDEPSKLLSTARSAAGLAEEDFIVPRIGETIQA